MARLSDMPDWERDNFLNKIPTLPAFDGDPWVTGPPLAERRIAIVTTAGVHVRGDRTFGAGAHGMDYRVIPADVDDADLIMSHQSVNFDRSGFQADVNVVLPLQRLKELADDHVIGSVADFHYSFMGAVIGEIITGGQGLGAQIAVYSATYDSADVFADLLLMALVATVLSGAINLLEARLLRWRGYELRAAR